MALGGGNWIEQNKALPGTYINFTSPLLVSTALSSRGVVAVAFKLSWGPEGEVFEINNESLAEDVQKFTGYSYSSEKSIYLRELFKNALKVYAFRLGEGSVKAENTFAVAKYGGTRGNEIKLAIKNSADDESSFVVETYFEGLLKDRQEVKTAVELVGNDWVDFKASATLVATASASLTGGEDATVTGESYTKFLNAIDSYSFNTLVCPTEDTATTDMFVSFSKRQNEEEGANFQLVCYRATSPDHETVVNVDNEAQGDIYSLVYWVAGALASCSAGESLTSKIYDGELSIDTSHTQTQLKQGILEGKFMLHNVNGVPKVLKDINSLVSFNDEKGQDFSSNQTVRICMGLSSDIATHFNEYYLGKVPNDESGRISLWNDLCKILTAYESERAIDSFSPEDVVVSVGEDRRNVLCSINGLKISGAMESLYMNIVII